MSLRLFALALLPLTLAAGCGEAPPYEGPRFGVELLVEQALVDELASFQLVMLTEGKQRDCTELQKTCLRLQVRQDEALVLKDSKGTEGRALRFPVSLSGSGTAQDVSIEVPVGRDYALVIEALSGDSPPRFLGSSCNYLDEVNASGNQPVLAAPMTLNAVACDPTFD
ncbi:MAG TPA: hypothetical protein VF815_18725 [Myxococcaceae bacterium]|jgi:hypothetical protein